MRAIGITLQLASRTVRCLRPIVLALIILTGGLSGATAEGRSRFEISTPAQVSMLQSIEALFEALNELMRNQLGIGSNFPYPDNFEEFEWHDKESPFLPALEALYYRIGDSRFQLALEAHTGMRWIGSAVLFSEAKGAIGIQIDLVDPKNPTWLLAVRVSPVFVELAWIDSIGLYGALPENRQNPWGKIELSRLQSLGGAIHLLFEHAFTPGLSAGLRVALRPGVQIGSWEDGISLGTAEALFLRAPLSLVLGMGPENGDGVRRGRFLELELRFSHLHRGGNFRDLITRATDVTARSLAHPVPAFSANAPQDIWEAAIFLNWRH